MGDRFAPVMLYEACSIDSSQGFARHRDANRYQCVTSIASDLTKSWVSAGMIREAACQICCFVSI